MLFFFPLFLFTLGFFYPWFCFSFPVIFFCFDFLLFSLSPVFHPLLCPLFVSPLHVLCFPTLFHRFIFLFLFYQRFLFFPLSSFPCFGFYTVFDCFLNFPLFYKLFSLCNLSLFTFTSLVFFLNPHRFVTLPFPNYSPIFFPLSCLPRYAYFSLCFISPFPLFPFVCVSSISLFGNKFSLWKFLFS